MDGVRQKLLSCYDITENDFKADYDTARGRDAKVTPLRDWSTAHVTTNGQARTFTMVLSSPRSYGPTCPSTTAAEGEQHKIEHSPSVTVTTGNMTFDSSSSHRMECLSQRWHKDVFFWSALRSFLCVTCLLLVLIASLYPGLWSIGVRLHSIFTGNYLPGHHSVLFINSPTEQTAKDIGRAIMEKRLAASINILTRTSTM
ncbi:hypothetical protein WMY93_021422 [Mugilogobius chulae]|uniref:Uncharacterized protein n=1 Tax=Mugilogobius chulae TaxID=88201 RepID=A0AAW0NFL2_9GOBI